jgi:hypothetical protein
MGARCDAKEECEERCLLDGPDYPGGFCTVSCLRDRDCPDGAACVQEAGGVCLFLCEVAEDCAFLGDGWTCGNRSLLPDGEALVCVGAQ